MIEAVLWDLGGVLCRFVPEKRTAVIAERTSRGVAQVDEVISPQIRAALDHGLVSGAELHDLVRDQLAWDGSYEELADAWSRAFEPDGEVLGILAKLTVPSAILSDNGRPLSDNFARLFPAVATLVTAAIFSGDLGVTKPNQSAFLLACERLGMAPAETLFIDDNAANVAGARSAGLSAIRFERASELEEALSKLDLIGLNPGYPARQ